MGEIIKKYIFAIILLLVVILAWAGFAFIYDTKESKENIEEGIYKTPLNKTFQKEELEEVYEKTSQKMPVPPKMFLNLKKKD